MLLIYNWHCMNQVFSADAKMCIVLLYYLAEMRFSHFSVIFQRSLSAYINELQQHRAKSNLDGWPLGIFLKFFLNLFFIIFHFLFGFRLFHVIFNHMQSFKMFDVLFYVRNCPILSEKYEKLTFSQKQSGGFFYF